MVLRSSKKAQDGAKAATLVAIIAGLILLYILFIPPAQRNELLNITNDTDDSNGGTGAAVSDKVLLLEHPGLLEYISAKEYEKSIPPTTLLVSTEAVTLKTAEAISVKNNWFSRQAYNLSFSIGDLDNTKNLIFSFNVDELNGPLIIELNGNVIYQKVPDKSNIALNIPTDGLSGQNSILIKAESVGFAFWKTNRHKLSNLKLIADVTDVSGRKSQSTFIISSSENNNIETARLRFYVDCSNRVDLGSLNVEINNHNVYSQAPVCGEIVSQPISPNILTSGENIITFSTEFKRPTNAYYQVDNILIRLELKEALPFTYYFDLNASQFNAVTAGTKDLNMKMLFTDSVSRKKAEIYINGIKTAIETRDYNYTRSINSFAKKGNNAIKIEPQTTFEIVDLEVELVD